MLTHLSRRRGPALFLLLVLIAGCGGSASGPTGLTGVASRTPEASTAAPATPTPMPTASPVPPATPTTAPTPTAQAATSAFSDPACGGTTSQAVVDDMIAAPYTLGTDRAEITRRWNEHSADADHAYSLDSWTSLEGSPDYASLVTPVTDAGPDVQLWSLDYRDGSVSSISLVMYPSQVQFQDVVQTDQLVDTLLSVFGQGPGLLRDLGLPSPFPGYRELEGVNRCAWFVFGGNYWARLVQVTDSSGEIYLYVRAATDAEVAAGKASVHSADIDTYAYPPVGQEAYAGFAPPLPSIPDVTGNPDGWITPIPSLLIRFKEVAGSPFLGSVTPVPGGDTVYRYPDDDGTALFTTDNPFNAAGMASGVGPLTFVGADTELRRYPPGVRMMQLLTMIVTEPTGEGLFFIDGARVACSWVGGAAEPAKRGVSRASVSPTCTGG